VDALRIEVDGRAATAEQLSHPALVNYGHFTAMQVRGGRVRGLELHLSRLDSANRELFGSGLDPELARDRLRHALVEIPDASVRVVVFWPDSATAPSVLVAVRPPDDAPGEPQRLMSVPYLRPVPHIKHIGGFGQIHYGRLARSQGFDDALLTGPDGVVSESARANVAVYDGEAVIWPDAPCLPGTAMQLLRRELPRAGTPSREARVRLADLPSVAAVFVANSIGIAPVTRVDDLTLSVDGALMKTVTEVYESVPWDSV
jgi:branched-subunit amino acid aminotransferase/4-amino-4-deoxychorismate lyase